MDLQTDLQRLIENGAVKAGKVRCASCDQKFDCSEMPPLEPFACPACGVELVTPLTFGDFQLCSLLHKGKKASIYMAQDCTLSRNVALKIPLNIEDNEYYHQCFSALAQNAHPGILWVYKFVQIGNLCCGALQYMDLGSCRNATELRRRFGSGAVLDSLLPVARALEQLEINGKTHRDICPVNLLCSSAGEIRMTNIHPGGEDEWDNFPRHWRYQAPESLRNMEFSAASDVYSFCISVYEILCSVYPFRNAGNPDDLLELIELQRPAALSNLNPQIPDVLADTLNAGMEAAPANRPPAGEIVRSMRKAMAEIMERELS